jgi:hypothetical protein
MACSVSLPGHGPKGGKNERPNELAFLYSVRARDGILGIVARHHDLFRLFQQGRPANPSH